MRSFHRIFRFLLRSSAFAAAITTAASAQRGAAAPKPLDRANLDTTCAACKDFYQFANGTWLAKHTIPPDKSGLGSFGMLGDKNQEVVQRIVDDDAKLVRAGETKMGTNEWKIGNFYMTCMDTAAMQVAGFQPIKATLDAIAAAKTTDDIVKAFGLKGAGGGGGGRGGGGGLAPFSLGPQTDPKNSAMVIVSANQGGLTLNREDYLGSDDRAQKRRADYVDHVSRSLQLIGETAAQAKARRRHDPLARDLDRTGHDPAGRHARSQCHVPQDAARRVRADGAPHELGRGTCSSRARRDVTVVNVRAPSFFRSLDSLVAATPVDGWKAYLRWHVTSGAMGSLSSAFRKEAFRWQQVTSGVQQQQPRVEQCASATNAAPRRGRRAGVGEAQFLPRGQGAGREDGRQPGVRASRSHQAARLDERTDQGPGGGQARRVPSEGRVPGQVARLLDAHDQCGVVSPEPARRRPSGIRRGAGRGWARRPTAPNGA